MLSVIFLLCTYLSERLRWCSKYSEEAGDLSETSSAKQGSSTPLEGTDAAIAHKPSDVLLDVDIDLPEVRLTQGLCTRAVQETTQELGKTYRMFQTGCNKL